MRNTIFWLTGMPCSGKTTIAKEIQRQTGAEILDGDDIRELFKNTDFSPEGRKKHMLAVAEIAYRISLYNTVVVALVSPIRKVREEIKNKYSNVKEVYVYASKEVCAERDVKGMWAKAKKGEIKNFTGYDAEYEFPKEKYLMVNTNVLNVKECSDLILKEHFKTYNLFIGRYQPLHEGHKKLVQTVLDKGENVMVALRNTGINENNPYTLEEREQMFEETFGDKVKVIRIPDIKSVCYGRGVGYEIKQIHLDKETESISATKIRNEKK